MLATAALAHIREQTAPKETGDTRADLVALLRHFRAGVERPFGMAMVGTVLAEERHTPELFVQFRKRLVEPRRQMLRSVLERAQARGELGESAGLETAVNMLVSGHWSKEREASLTPPDFRASAPRFQGENLERNLALVEALRTLADEKGATVAQIAIAWVLSRGEDVVPLVGARTRERLAESLGAVDIELTQDDLAAIGAAVSVEAVAGDRYHAEQMAILDSERG